MRREHEADIRWFFDGSRDAALGMKSNHASFVARCEGSTGNGNDPDAAQKAEDSRCEAVRRERNISDVLGRISKAGQRVLAAWARPDHLVPYWGTLTHVLPLCDAFDEAKHGGRAGESLALRMGLDNPKDGQKETALRLRRSAEVAVAAALTEYGAIFEAAAEKGRAA